MRDGPCQASLILEVDVSGGTPQTSELEASQATIKAHEHGLVGIHVHVAVSSDSGLTGEERLIALTSFVVEEELEAGGSGVLLARDIKTGEWSYPAFYTLGSLSIGLQAGAESSEIILMVMTDRGMGSMLTSSFKLGADVTMAAGPVGVGAKAKTADIISYARAKGAFAGVSLDGAVVKTRDGLNGAYYGKTVSPTDILIRRDVSNGHAEQLRAAVKAVASK